MKSRSQTLWVLGLALGALSCGGDQAGERPRTGPSDPPAEAPARAPTLDPTLFNGTPSGLYYQDLVVGEGAEAVVGHAVTVHYTGWLLDGARFDSSRDRAESFTFPLGQGRVIRGWDEGVVGMKVGGKRRLVIPSELGYGARGFPPVIPPNATLVFDVELLGVGG